MDLPVQLEGRFGSEVVHVQDVMTIGDLKDQVADMREDLPRPCLAVYNSYGDDLDSEDEVSFAQTYVVDGPRDLLSKPDNLWAQTQDLEAQEQELEAQRKELEAQSNDLWAQSKDLWAQSKDATSADDVTHIVGSDEDVTIGDVDLKKPAIIGGDGGDEDGAHEVTGDDSSGTPEGKGTANTQAAPGNNSPEMPSDLSKEVDDLWSQSKDAFADRSGKVAHIVGTGPNESVTIPEAHFQGPVTFGGD